MSDVYVMAEAAQGYLPLVGDSGSVDIALLLVKAAAGAQADAVKFQIVYVDELAQPGNIHFDIFRRLEMSQDAWRGIRDYARRLGIHFVADVFGGRSLDVARAIGVDGIKIHSTSFFDHELVASVTQLGCPVYFSTSGIERAELDAFIARQRLREHGRATLLYGFQSEPTPMEQNNLARIPALRTETGLAVGFMDHCDGAGPDDANLSVLALGLGVRVFEKHVTLDRELGLEDFVSALPPGRLHQYVTTLRRLATALGSPDLNLTEAERKYRDKALKRTVAARTLRAGARIQHADVRLIRPAEPRGALDLELVVGRTLRKDVVEGSPIMLEDLK